MAERAIVTPIWREQPNSIECMLLGLTDARTGSTPKFFAAPKGLDLRFYANKFPEWRIERFEPSNFQSVATYSRWLLDEDLYKRFQSFEEIVLTQLDAVIYRDISQLDFSGIDYLGAPWVPSWRVSYIRGKLRWIPIVSNLAGRRLSVGNGGLSIRRTDAFVRFTRSIGRELPESLLASTNEDMVISYFGPKFGLRLSDASVAAGVFSDLRSDTMIRTDVGYGVHGIKSDYDLALISLQN